jgi:thiamine transporter ThiT
MKHLLPDRVELSVLAALALVCALVVELGVNADYLLALLAIPLFITSAVMGLRRNWKLADAQQPARDDARAD